MSNTKPRLSIGLPIYNGEQYLAKALDSILQQTFTEFELIISDNASTDSTREICEAYAARDLRICYHRNPENIGAMQNWYRVFELSSAEYFASIADDDFYHPEYMQKCVAVLDADPSVAVCHSRTSVIDADDNFNYNFDVHVDTTSPRPSKRLYNIIAIDLLCIQLYGVMRSKALAATKVFTGYDGSDRNTLVELCLLGKIVEIPDHLFFHRLYADALGAAMNSGKSLEELQSLDPGVDWRYRSTFPTIYRNYFSSVTRLVPSSSERMWCYLQLTRLVFEKSAKRLKHRIYRTRS
jgi:glycosyltransferase involved in cell wall biosynthesis